MAKIVKRNDWSKNLDLDQQIELEESADIPSQTGRVIRKEVHQSSDEVKKIIEAAKAEAARLKKEAKEILTEIESQREQARKQGFEEGKEEGLSEVSELIATATQLKENQFDGLEKDILNLVFDIAEKVIGRELQTQSEAVIDLVKQALQAAMGQKIIILVHPEDFEILKKAEAQLVHCIESSKTLQIRSDENVEPKGCVIETEIGTIDAQLKTQMAAIKHALGLEEE